MGVARSMTWISRDVVSRSPTKNHFSTTMSYFLHQVEKEELQGALEEAEGALEQEENKVGLVKDTFKVDV